MDDQASGITWPGHLQWHGDMHRQLGGRSLFFWFLRFEGMYSKDETFETLRECMEEVGGVAYAGYELSGEFDVMLRLWLPPTAVGRFEELLKKRLRVLSARYHSVVETIRHWVWDQRGNGAGHATLSCEIDSLDGATLLDDVDTLNELSDASRERDTVRVASSVDAAVLDRFLSAGAITPVHSQNGIRLALRLRPSQELRDMDLIRVAEAVAQKLDHLSEDEVERSEAQRSTELRIRELSLYRCADSTIVALCRIEYRAWHLLREQLISPLGEVPGLEQTTTFPVLSAKLEVSRERLQLDGDVRDTFGAKRPPRDRESPEEEPVDPSDLPPPPSQPSAVRPFLDREEGPTFEAKGSAFTKLEDWLNRDPDDPDDFGLVEEAGFFRDTIAKSIVAMLNTSGGQILIGVLEADRFAMDDRDRIRLRVEAFPREGRFRLLGLQDPIYRRRGWDGFDRKFHELLGSMVDATIGRRVQLVPGWHDGREFAIVQVRGPKKSTRRRPFYLLDGGPTFYIRRGGRNEPLDGGKVHEYLEDD
jgi:hypothetical protein